MSVDPADEPGVRVVNARCTIRVDDEVCPEPGVYDVRFADCPGVACTAGCQGHRSCVPCAARVRSGRYETLPGPAWVREQDLDVARITNGLLP